MLRSPIRWVGGKCRLRETILKLFPEHGTYVELFSGAAWVLFGKDSETSRCEILNDLDGQLVSFWRVIKHRPAEFAERASKLLGAREMFDEWKAMGAHEDEIERAVRFFFVIRVAYGARRMGACWGTQRGKRPAFWWASAEEDIGKAMERLRSVWIENLPWPRCVALYDSPETFFYADPPYRCAGSNSYAHVFSDDDHRALAAALRGVQGKWLLSYNDDPFIVGLYRGKGIKIERAANRYGLQGGLWKKVRELLIRNY